MTLFQTMNAQFTGAQNLDFLVRMLIAAFCGAVIGYERSKRFKEAGVRTHVIVCFAAALMMIVSKYGFADMSSESGAMFSGTRGADPARIAAQVVSGISFLGAGMIFKNGSSIKGLTTAAGVWATAGIGLALGAGLIWIGLMGTAIVCVLQYTFHIVKIGADSFVTNYLEIVTTDNTDFYQRLKNVIEGLEAQVVDMQISRNGDRVRYTVHLKMKISLNDDEIYAFFEDYPEIISITIKVI